MKSKGSHNGNNGIWDIVNKYKRNDFNWILIGIDRPNSW